LFGIGGKQGTLGSGFDSSLFLRSK